MESTTAEDEVTTGSFVQNDSVTKDSSAVVGSDCALNSLTCSTASHLGATTAGVPWPSLSPVDGLLLAVEEEGAPVFPTWALVVMGLLAGCTSLVTVSGNLIVILSFVLERSIRQPSNYFIASLAVSDLLIGTVSMPFYSVYLLTGQHWPLGETLCDLWLSVDYTACLCSIYTVFCITVDRFCSVRIPAKYRNWRTEYKVLAAVAMTWVVPVLVFFPSIFGWQIFVGGRTVPEGKCYVQYMDDALFNCVLQVGYFWVTLSAMVALYAAIYRVALGLQRKSEKMAKKRTSGLQAASQGANAQTMTSHSVVVIASAAADDNGNRPGDHVTDRDGRKKKGGCDDEGGSAIEPPATGDDDIRSTAPVEVARKPEQDSTADGRRSKNDVIAGRSNDFSRRSSSAFRSFYSAKSSPPAPPPPPPSSQGRVGQTTRAAGGVKRPRKALLIERRPQIGGGGGGGTDGPQYELRWVEEEEGKEDDVDSCNSSSSRLFEENVRLLLRSRRIDSSATDSPVEEDEDEEEGSCSPGVPESPVWKKKKKKKEQGPPESSSPPPPSESSLTTAFDDSLSTSTVHRRSIVQSEKKNEDDDGGSSSSSSSSSREFNERTGKESPSEEEEEEEEEKKKGRGNAKTSKRTNGDALNKMAAVHPSAIFVQLRRALNRQEIELKQLRGHPSNPHSHPHQRPFYYYGDDQSTSLRPSGGVAPLRSVLRRLKGSDHRDPGPSPPVVDETTAAAAAGDLAGGGAGGKCKRVNRARKALRTITVILGAFVVCWTPWHVLSLVIGFCSKDCVCVAPLLYDISYWLCYLNSPLNPLCYALANQQFKKTFARILRLDWHRN